MDFIVSSMVLLAAILTIINEIERRGSRQKKIRAMIGDVEMRMDRRRRFRSIVDICLIVLSLLFLSYFLWVPTVEPLSRRDVAEIGILVMIVCVFFPRER